VGTSKQLVLGNDFVIGEYTGYPVPWRGTAPAVRRVAATDEMSEYAALFYGGPDAANRQVPSCEEVRTRLRGGIRRSVE
jgi:hypothetical protein